MTSIQKTISNLFRYVVPQRNPKRNFTVCVEGNIGSGKTTFLDNFKAFNNTTVLQEPVQLWRDVAGTNLMDLMYTDPARYACLFQLYVQLTMTQLHALNTSKPYKIMERSAYSARIFIENMKRMKTLQEVELFVIEAWYDWSIENIQTKTDLIVYLRTTPEVVYQRMRERGRKEEDCVSLEYLKQLHQLHEEWLIERKLFVLPAPVIVLNGDKNIEEMMTEFNVCKDIIYNKQIANEAATKDTKSRRIKKLIAGASD